MSSHLPQENSGLRILIVEDNQIVGEIMQDFLFSTWKQEPLLFSSGEDALDYLRQEAKKENPWLPQLIILDLALPDANGLDILEQIKLHEKLKWIHVIIYTGSDDLGDKLRAGKFTNVTFLKKGMGHKDLARTIETLKAKNTLK